MAGVVEIVHQRQPDDLVAAGGPEQYYPGVIGIGDDPFLDQCDRSRRLLHVVLELLLVLSRRVDRGVQRAFDAQRAQLARDDGLETVLEVHRDEVAGAQAHGFLDAGLVRLRGERDDGNLGVMAILLLDDFADRVGVSVAIQDQQLDVLGVERLAEIFRLADPVAMGGVARIAQRAVNQRDIVLSLGQDGD